MSLQEFGELWTVAAFMISVIVAVIAVVMLCLWIGPAIEAHGLIWAEQVWRDAGLEPPGK